MFTVLALGGDGGWESAQSVLRTGGLGPSPFLIAAHLRPQTDIKQSPFGYFCFPFLLRQDVGLLLGDSTIQSPWYPGGLGLRGLLLPPLDFGSL